MRARGGPTSGQPSRDMGVRARNRCLAVVVSRRVTARNYDAWVVRWMQDGPRGTMSRTMRWNRGLPAGWIGLFGIVLSGCGDDVGMEAETSADAGIGLDVGTSPTTTTPSTLTVPESTLDAGIVSGPTEDASTAGPVVGECSNTAPSCLEGSDPANCGFRVGYAQCMDEGWTCPSGSILETECCPRWPAPCRGPCGAEPRVDMPTCVGNEWICPAGTVQAWTCIGVAPADGGPVVTLVSGGVSPSAIALDSTSV